MSSFNFIWNNTKNEKKTCPMCKKEKSHRHYIRTIRRRTYGICCDDDGYEYFAKETILCLDCREISRNRLEKHKRKKHPIEYGLDILND